MDDVTGEHTVLKKDLGVREVFSIAAGAMISSGLFVLPGVLYEMTGPSTWIAYLIAAFLVFPTLVAKAELATAMPKAGGDYYFIDRALGAAVGTLAGFSAWFSLSLKTAFALFGVGAFLLVLEPTVSTWTMKGVAIAVTAGVTVLNIVGVKSAARVQNTLVLGLLLVLVTFLALTWTEVELSAFDAPLRSGWGGLATATGTAFIAYGGLTKAAAVAEEVTDPGRVLPRAMFLAFGIVTLLYVSVVAVTIGVLGDSMAGDLNPVAHAAQKSFGTPGLVLLSGAALAAYLTTGNAGVMAASRTPMAMSRDQLLPRRLSQVHPRLGTPIWSVGLTALFMIGSIAFLDLETLVKTASVMMILLFLLVNVAVIVMRESKVAFYRPTFRVPLYPVTPVLGVVLYAALSFKLGLQPMLIAGGFLLTGLAWYALFARVQVQRQSAVLHMVGEVASSQGEDIIGIEAELLSVLRDRDGLEADEFDELLHKALVEDCEHATVEEVAEVAGALLGGPLGMDPDELAVTILDREQKTSSIMVPGLATILIKAPDHDRAQVLLFRCRSGIDWPGADSPVHAVIFLGTTKDHRHQRLRVLTYLAQIVHNPDFGPRWMQIKDPRSLPELLIMGARHRAPMGNRFQVED